MRSNGRTSQRAEGEGLRSGPSAMLIALATRRIAPFYQSLGYELSATYFRKVL